MSAIDVVVGENLRRIRVQRGLAHDTLAARCGIDVDELRAFESGARPVRPAELMALTRALRVSARELFLSS